MYSKFCKEKIDEEELMWFKLLLVGTWECISLELGLRKLQVQQEHQEQTPMDDGQEAYKASKLVRWVCLTMLPSFASQPFLQLLFLFASAFQVSQPISLSVRSLPSFFSQPLELRKTTSQVNTKQRIGYWIVCKRWYTITQRNKHLLKKNEMQRMEQNNIIMTVLVEFK